MTCKPQVTNVCCLYNGTSPTSIALGGRAYRDDASIAIYITSNSEEGPVKYIVLTYETSPDFAARTDAAGQADYWSRWRAYGQAMTEAGVVTSMHGLKPPHTAKTVRVRDGVRHTRPMPFADTAEQLGGYFVIDVDDEQQALEWAAKCPAAAPGAVEVRPVLG